MSIDPRSRDHSSTSKRIVGGATPLVLLALAACSPAAETSTQTSVAAILSGSQSLTAVSDTYINQGSATTNYGTATTCTVDGAPSDLTALVQWNLTGIPVGSTIKTARIRFNVTNTSPSAYQVYRLLRSWSESGATWNKATATTSWQTSGALGATDRASTNLGQVVASATGTVEFALNATGVSAVQAWVNTPSANYGVAIANATNSDDFAFSARESTAAVKPTLVVTYDLPASCVPEVCDGVDNDCNGSVDEGTACSCTNHTTCTSSANCCAGGACLTGQCGCPAGTSLCAGGVCVNTATSTSDCGACGHACAAGQTCSAGVCSTPSDPCAGVYCGGTTTCYNGTCVPICELNIDCPNGQVCVNSVCRAP